MVPDFSPLIVPIMGFIGTFIGFITGLLFCVIAYFFFPIALSSVMAACLLTGFVLGTLVGIVMMVTDK